jgi:hypothetical protein
LFDRLSGSYRKTQTRNEQEAYLSAKRDQKQRDDLISLHMKDRHKLQNRFDELSQSHREDRSQLAHSIRRSIQSHRTDHTHAQHHRQKLHFSL